MFEGINESECFVLRLQKSLDQFDGILVCVNRFCDFWRLKWTNSVNILIFIKSENISFVYKLPNRCNPFRRTKNYALKRRLKFFNFNELSTKSYFSRRRYPEIQRFFFENSKERFCRTGWSFHKLRLSTGSSNNFFELAKNTLLNVFRSTRRSEQQRYNILTRFSTRTSKESHASNFPACIYFPGIRIAGKMKNNR